jgi:phytoene dehydrogenase-like protein
MADITVVGGGLAGLVASIACAERGASVDLYEAHQTLGGRARTSAPPFIAHDGPHVIYDDGPLWAWLDERDLVAPAAHVPHRALASIRFRWRAGLRRRPPTSMLWMLAERRRRAPVDQDFRTWASERFGETAAMAAASYLGVVTFDHDPGRLSAAFAWERLVRATSVPPAARYVIGGWGSMLARLEARARKLGVSIELGSRVDSLPEPPVIVATSLDAAGRLLGDPGLRWESGRTALLDLGLERRRADPFILADLDEAGWVERFSVPDPTVAPPGRSLAQAQLPLRHGEHEAEGLERLERLVDLGYPRWRERQVWRRHGIAAGRSGALDLPGTTWRDRPRVNRGDGVFLAGDMVAAPGLLSEVSFTSAIKASAAAVGLLRPNRHAA